MFTSTLSDKPKLNEACLLGSNVKERLSGTASQSFKDPPIVVRVCRTVLLFVRCEKREGIRKSIVDVLIVLRRGNVSDPSASTAQRISAAQHGYLGQSEVQNAGSPGVALHLRSGQAPGRQFIAKDGIHQSKLNKTIK